MTEGSLTVRETVPGDLNAILELARAWPTHFVEAGVRMIESDFRIHLSAIASLERQVVGFIIWRKDGRETELLWVAVNPQKTRRGVGRALVHHMLVQAKGSERIFALTATTDSRIPDSAFDGALFAGTHEFFGQLGFTKRTVLSDYWGPHNHALRMELELRS